MSSLTVEQILDAARALTLRQQRRVIEDLEQNVSREEAIKVARRLRKKYKLPPERQKRMSQLLRENGERPLTPDERRELDAFIDEYEQRALEMAEELARTANDPNRPQVQNRNGEDA